MIVQHEFEMELEAFGTGSNNFKHVFFKAHREHLQKLAIKETATK